jgi:hypothetical protein
MSRRENKEDFNKLMSDAIKDGCLLTLVCFVIIALFGLIISLL